MFFCSCSAFDRKTNEGEEERGLRGSRGEEREPKSAQGSEQASSSTPPTSNTRAFLFPVRFSMFSLLFAHSFFPFPKRWNGTEHAGITQSSPGRRGTKTFSVSRRSALPIRNCGTARFSIFGAKIKRKVRKFGTIFPPPSTRFVPKTWKGS